MQEDEKMEAALIFENALAMTDSSNRDKINHFYSSISQGIPEDTGADINDPDGDELPAPSENQDGIKYACKTQRYDISTAPREIVTFSPDVDVVWPGALIQGGTPLGLGSLREVPIRKRSDMILAVNYLSSANTAVMDRPSPVGYLQALGGLIEPLASKSIDFGSNI